MAVHDITPSYKYSFKAKLKEYLKKYKFIRSAYEAIVRPARRMTRNFCLHHEPFRRAIISFKGYKLFRLSTVYDYCREHDSIIKVYDDSCQYPARPLCRTREEFEANIFSEPVIRPSYYIYVSKIYDATIFGHEDLFIAKGCLLNDRKKGSNENPFYISANIPEIGEEYALVKPPKSSDVIERGIDLVKMWSGNYYHFSFEALARLQLVDSLEEYRSWPLLIAEPALRNVWNIQLLNILEHSASQHGKYL